jgi:cytosolic carboxypeptidase protein 2/3
LLAKNVRNKSNFLENDFISFESLGKSLGGLDIPILKIRNLNEDQPERPIIVIIARQHTGETHSSFILHGLINHLVAQNILSHKMRDEFEFWILPVVNPDGVIIGNYRCNL